MNILSLFDGISCGQVALNRAGIEYDNYFASEIDKYAIKVTQKNYPVTIQLGDVRNLKAVDLPKIDLLIGGSPCQGFSFAGKQLNFNDERSRLFFEYVRLLKECKPKYFLLENVKMKKIFSNKISEILGVDFIEIDSSLVSAQNRKRLYWTNIPNVKQPSDRKILLKDILEIDGQGINYSSSGRGGGIVESRINEAIKALTLTKTGYNKRALTAISVCQLPHGFNSGGVFDRKKMPTVRKATKDNYYIINGEKFRKFTSVELERLQTLPDNYTQGVSDAQRGRLIGDGWTVDVIAHILNGLN